jgi:lipoprotein-releasing system ATP-binding protein
VSQTPPALRVEDLTKSFEKGGRTLHVLQGASLVVGAGERLSIIGQSGSGKSTFLHLVGTLDQPTSGRIWVGGEQVSDRRARDLDALRNKHIGFVFQFHHLLPDQDALRNVMMPALIGGVSAPEAASQAAALLERVGLSERMNHRPGELSGGEQQRVALARALVMDPAILLADEPTGNLDPSTADEVFDLLLELNEERGTTLVVVTHSQSIAARFPRCVELVQGRFEERST